VFCVLGTKQLKTCPQINPGDRGKNAIPKIKIPSYLILKVSVEYGMPIIILSYFLRHFVVETTTWKISGGGGQIVRWGGMLQVLNLVHTSNSVGDFSLPGKCDRMTYKRLVYFWKATLYFCVRLHSFTSVRNTKSPTKLLMWTRL
jgi:hypothetical protein